LVDFFGMVRLIRQNHLPYGFELADEEGLGAGSPGAPDGADPIALPGPKTIN
jgi:hypothetical protein